MKYVIQTVLLIIFGLLQISAQELFITIKVDSTNSGSGSTGKGTGYAILSNDMKTLRFRITVNNLSGNITGAHFHYSPSGGVVHPITFTGNTAIGTWSNIPDTLVSALLKDNLYLNIHTAKNPGGEIRGNFNLEQFGFPIDINGVNAGTSSAGIGTGYAYFDKSHDTSSVSEIYYRATFAGLSGNITSAHFHELPGGTVAYPITFVDSTTDGILTGFSDANLLKFFKSQMYLNIHSNVNPGGEIRGNLSVVGELGFAGILDGAQAGTSSNGKGTVWVILRPDMSVKYNATYAKLTTPLSGSHFHTSTNGGVVKPVTFINNNTSGDWTGMSDANITDLLKGRIYMNIHSSTNPGGEIRANMFYSTGLFTGMLDGTQASTSSTAKGTVWIDIGGDSARYHATIAGLNGTLSGSHFHTTDGGAVIKPVTFVDSTTTGYWNMQDRMVDLALGKIYLNVHSSINAGGEIRGNLKLGSGVTTSVRSVSEQVPTAFILNQNYPNPFNPTTTISYQLPNNHYVTLKVYDILGKEVTTLVSEMKEAGNYNVQLSTNSYKLSSGIYFYRLTAGNYTATKKLVLMK